MVAGGITRGYKTCIWSKRTKNQNLYKSPQDAAQSLFGIRESREDYCRCTLSPRVQKKKMMMMLTSILLPCVFTLQCLRSMHCSPVPEGSRYQAAPVSGVYLSFIHFLCLIISLNSQNELDSNYWKFNRFCKLTIIRAFQNHLLFQIMHTRECRKVCLVVIPSFPVQIFTAVGENLFFFLFFFPNDQCAIPTLQFACSYDCAEPWLTDTNLLNV